MKPAAGIPVLLAVGSGSFAQPTTPPPGSPFNDAIGDATVRRTDSGANGPLNPSGVLPDLIQVRIDGWAPTDPPNDPYSGAITPAADALFVRIELDFAGLVCPPGPLGLAGDPYDPFRFGDTPLFGFLDIDADNRIDTGGEIGGGALERYLASVGRFGARPPGGIGSRAATSSLDLDADFFSDPQYERSGADLALEFCGCFEPLVVSENGDLDGRFDPGETWIVNGRFFQRTRGYVGASAAFGGSDFGHYDPFVDLRFTHDEFNDITTITLVYPLTMPGAAALTGEPEQPIDLDVSNHTSIAEAIQDVIDGAAGTNEPTRTLAQLWIGGSTADLVKPKFWTPTALFGTAYLTPEDGLFVWTDTGFNEIVGDLSGDSHVSPYDLTLFDQTLAELDGGPGDLDGAVNGSVSIAGFGAGFNMADFTGDGVIDSQDRVIVNPCIADVTTQNASAGDPEYGVPDGVVSAADVQYYVNLWITRDPAADLTTTNAPAGDPEFGVPDGSVSAVDIQYYVNAWIAGCP